MKSLKFNIYLLLLPLALLMLSCEDDNDGASDLEVIKTTIDTTPAKLTGEIELSNPNFEFNLRGGDWCEAVKDGNKIILKAGTNYEFNNRTVEVIISSGHTQYRIPVTQTGVVFELLDDRITQYNYSLHGDERILELMTNVEYEIIIPEADKNWISVEKIGDGANSLKIKVEGSEKLRHSTIDIQVYGKNH